MQLIILCGLIAAAVADRLGNTYLPPSNARTAGGNGNFLNTPFGSSYRSGVGQGNGATSKNYLPPNSRFGRVGGNGQGAVIRNFGQKSNTFGASSGLSGFGQKASNAFGTGSSVGFSGATAFGQAPSSQYGAPSVAYGVPSGAAVRYGGSQSRDAGAAIIRSNNENFGDGSYRFDFETENKISHREAGELKNAGSDYESSSVQGSYTYIGDDGKSYQVNYIADENGFQPIGDHLPTSPPIPEAIQRSLIKNSQQGGSIGGHHAEYHSSGGSQSASRQYLAPNKPGFNAQTGYQY